MASYAYGAAAAQYHSRTPSQQHSQHNHHNRSRRGPRIASQNAHRHYKAAQRSTKEVVADTRACSEYLQRLEAARSFEFDDDELQSIHSSSSSDRGSLSSDSPEGSPLQQQVQPTPSFLLSTATSSTPGYFHHQQQHQHQQHQHQHNNVKLHQPMAQRTRNAIPIVDPSTRSVASPPLSISPARAMQQQQYQVPRRW